MFGSNAVSGEGDIIIVEADEYDRTFLRLTPIVAVITNIEADHLDIYEDLDDIKDAFVQFANSVPFFGAAILCLDDENVREVLGDIHRPRDHLRHEPAGARSAPRTSSRSAPRRSSTCPTGSSALGERDAPRAGPPQRPQRARRRRRRAGAGHRRSRRSRPGSPATRASTAASRSRARSGDGDRSIVDDYAHHPTEIEATLEAAAKGWPDRRVVAVFQPHLYSRTRDFAGRLRARLLRRRRARADRRLPARARSPSRASAAGLLADLASRYGHRDVHYVADKATSRRTCSSARPLRRPRGHDGRRRRVALRRGVPRPAPDRREGCADGTRSPNNSRRRRRIAPPDRSPSSCSAPSSRSAGRRGVWQAHAAAGARRRRRARSTPTRERRARPRRRGPTRASSSTPRPGPPRRPRAPAPVGARRHASRRCRRARSRIAVRSAMPVALVLDGAGRPSHFLDAAGFAMPLAAGRRSTTCRSSGPLPAYHPTQPVESAGRARPARRARRRARRRDRRARLRGRAWSGRSCTLVTARPPAGTAILPSRSAARGFAEKLGRLHAFWDQAVLTRPDTPSDRRPPLRRPGRYARDRPRSVAAPRRRVRVDRRPPTLPQPYTAHERSRTHRRRRRHRHDQDLRGRRRRRRARPHQRARRRRAPSPKGSTAASSSTSTRPCGRAGGRRRGRARGRRRGAQRRTSASPATTSRASRAAA